MAKCHDGRGIVVRARYAAFHPDLAATSHWAGRPQRNRQGSRNRRSSAGRSKSNLGSSREPNKGGDDHRRRRHFYIHPSCTGKLSPPGGSRRLRGLSRQHPSWNRKTSLVEDQTESANRGAASDRETGHQRRSLVAGEQHGVNENRRSLFQRAASSRRLSPAFH